MLEITLLGTGGMIPLPGRFLTALMVETGGKAVLVDCGEGTQVAIRAAKRGFRRIDAICLTHFHADHVAGLPGLLLTIGNSGRSEPITIIGPQYTEEIVRCLCVIAPQLPYEVHFQEAGPNLFHKVGLLRIEALPVEHMIPCFAYRFTLPRAAKFLPDRARELGVPLPLWRKLQSGEEACWDGHTVTPEQVTGPARPGLSLCYATDMRPSSALVDFARNTDLFVCEGNYGDPAKLEKAKLRGHCTFEEAADMARQADVKELWLTHYSASMPEPELYLPLARDIFSNTHINMGRKVLTFSDL